MVINRRKSFAEDFSNSIVTVIIVAFFTSDRRHIF